VLFQPGPFCLSQHLGFLACQGVRSGSDWRHPSNHLAWGERVAWLHHGVAYSVPGIRQRL